MNQLKPNPIFRLVFLVLLIQCTSELRGQELYVATEPASNMAAGSVGVRMTNRLFYMDHDGSYRYRLEPEFMVGISKKWMAHLNFYASNMFEEKFRFEGASVYTKYRFYSQDDIHSHFRLAAFGKMALVDNPNGVKRIVKHDLGDGTYHEITEYVYSDEIELDGNNSGINGGLVATQLLHKLALSGSASYTQRWKNGSQPKEPGLSNHALNYSFSGGYLLLPRHYQDYRQVNVNVYVEFLGSASLDKNGNYLDMMPSIQFIFNSISRLDLAYRTQISGNMSRYNSNSWMLRLEYNFLNIFRKKG